MPSKDDKSQHSQSIDESAPDSCPRVLPLPDNIEQLRLLCADLHEVIKKRDLLWQNRAQHVVELKRGWKTLQAGSSSTISLEALRRLEAEFTQLEATSRHTLVAVVPYLDLSVEATPSREPLELDLPDSIAECQRAVTMEREINCALAASYRRVCKAIDEKCRSQPSQRQGGTNQPRKKTPDQADYLTPPQVGKKLGVKPETVIQWIRNGKLPAINVAKNGCSRPRFRIALSSIQAFAQLQSVDRPPKTRRQKKTTGKDRFTHL